MIGGKVKLPRSDRPGVALVVRAAQGLGDGEGGLGIKGRLVAGEEVGSGKTR
jgi:hypothetical protein